MRIKFVIGFVLSLLGLGIILAYAKALVLYANGASF